MYLVDEAAHPSLGQHDRPRKQVGVAERATGVARLRPDEPCFVQRSRRAEAGKVELKKKNIQGGALGQLVSWGARNGEQDAEEKAG